MAPGLHGGVCAVLVQHKVLPDGSQAPQPDLTPCGQAQGPKRDIMRRLVAKAKEDWRADNHPNWSIRDTDSGVFLDSLQPGQVVPSHAPSTCRNLQGSLELVVFVDRFFKFFRRPLVNSCELQYHVQQATILQVIGVWSILC